MAAPTKFRLNDHQLKRASSVSADLGKAAIIGSTAYLAANLDKRPVPLLPLVGEVAGGLLIGFSLSLLKRVKK